jgi:hypothetical protein
MTQSAQCALPAPPLGLTVLRILDLRMLHECDEEFRDRQIFGTVAVRQQATQQSRDRAFRVTLASRTDPGNHLAANVHAGMADRFV